MDENLEMWITIIEGMQNDNTYKTAWGRGLVEYIYSLEESDIEEITVIPQSKIAENMIKYYWNQTFFFGLSQGRNPEIVTVVKEMIHKYKKEVNSYPQTWDKVEVFFKSDQEYFTRIINRILRNAKVNVCPRFLRVKSEIIPLYEIDKNEKALLMKRDVVIITKEYASVLTKLFNYKWAQLLERFNTAPNISKKVIAATDRKIKRESLTKYRNLLLSFYEKNEIRDFYTGEIIDKNDVHIDHVIPWSFVFENEIWNLVVTKSTTNLEKSNRAPSENDIERLQKRNIELAERLKYINPSEAEKVKYAVENNIVKKLYINLKG